jgi:exodeoxyribonuclease VIII
MRTSEIDEPMTDDGTAHWFCGLKNHDPGMDFGPLDDRQVVSTDLSDRCRYMADALRSHGRASRILDQALMTEVSAVAVFDGLAMKMRWDIVGPSGLADIKSGEDISPEAMSKSLIRWKWHRQGAIYERGGKSLDVPVPNYLIVAVESVEPFGVAVYRLDAAAIRLGWKQTEPLLIQYAACVRSGAWPGYAEQITDISVPSWALRELEE